MLYRNINDIKYKSGQDLQSFNILKRTKTWFHEFMSFRKHVIDEYKYREIHTAAFKTIDRHNINFISRVSMSVHNIKKHGRSDFKRCFNVIVLHCIWLKEHAIWATRRTIFLMAVNRDRDKSISYSWTRMLCIFVCVNSNSIILLAIILNDNFLRTFKIL